ncbi:MAG: DUF4363 family protein [Lutisporaceae bacterium]
MKSILLSAIFLAAIIIGSLASIYYISNQSETMLELLTTLEKHIDSEDWDEANSTFKNFKDNWTKIDPKWSMLIDHYEIDYINMNLGELDAFIKSKDKTNALAKMSSLQLLVKHIPEKEYVNLKNIF